MFLAGLIALSVGAAIVSGMVLYTETSRKTETQADAITRGDWRAGKQVVTRYNCGSCHKISGIDGASGMVGPDLADIGKRVTIAGSLPNDPETMVRWLMHPQQLHPGSGMPEMGLTEKEARDAAAFLYAKQ
ncbi:MAG: cytochrome c [Sphingomonas sp.]|nr:MAG: cytochrome c [Sphingomonas sp.]